MAIRNISIAPTQDQPNQLAEPLPEIILDGLAHFNYPFGRDGDHWTSALSGAVIQAGIGNVCLIAGQYSRPFPNDIEDESFIQSHIEDNGNFYIITRNQGTGGTHSEIVGLPRIQTRHLVNSAIHLFTERQPCNDCQLSLDVRGEPPRGLDISVYYYAAYGNGVQAHVAQGQTRTCRTHISNLLIARVQQP